MNTKCITGLIVNFMQPVVHSQCRPQYFFTSDEILHIWPQYLIISIHKHSKRNDPQKLWLALLQAPARSRPNTRSPMVKVYEKSQIRPPWFTGTAMTFFHTGQFQAKLQITTTNFNYLPPTKLRESNVFTGMFLSMVGVVSLVLGGCPGDEYLGCEYSSQLMTSSGSHQNMYGWLAGGMYATGMLSCFGIFTSEAAGNIRICRPDFYQIMQNKIYCEWCVWPLGYQDTDSTVRTLVLPCVNIPCIIIWHIQSVKTHRLLPLGLATFYIIIRGTRFLSKVSGL